MKRILLSSALLFSAIGVAVAGGTSAFFSDAETSSGNTFTAGAIDLKVDNSSYYNGLFNPGTSWDLDDLTSTIHKFFNFSDVKPNDYGEDTISLHVNTNDAYLCANVTLTSNDDNGFTEPEAQVDTTDGAGNGELAQAINFIWWADDGDNVLESGETVISSGPLGAIGPVGSSVTVPLADSSTNIWNAAAAPGPLAGDTTKYIGKAWCFGAITPTPLAQDGVTTRTPAGDNDVNGTAGQPADGGYLCNGSALGNETQTDSLTADVSFSATQARNNSTFLCSTGTCTFDPLVNIVTDGGFETPVVVNGAQWDVFPSPVNGWVVSWRDAGTTSFGSQTRPATANLELHRGVLGPASEGSQYAELDTDWGGPSDPGTGEPAAVSIAQTITTVPGAQYSLTYAFAPRPNTTADQNNLEVRWGGNVVSAVGPVAGGGGDPVWADHNVVFTATTTTTVLRFTDLGTSDSVGTFLDNVRLNQISCPNQ